MRDVYAAYPEVLFVDATHKLTSLNLAVYLFVIEDGLGLSEIIGVGLVAEEEDGTSLRWLMETLKSTNECSSITRVIMADKDITERKVFKEVLPDVALNICLFHTLRTFKREVTAAKMGISQALVEVLAELFQKMAYSDTLETYVKHQTDFLEVSPIQVKNYFNDNWDHLCDEWVVGLQQQSGNFGNSTNNRVESLNSKLKSVIKLYSSLEEFGQQFFSILSTLRVERDHKAADLFQKVMVIGNEHNSHQKQYSLILTNYSCDHVLKQMNLAEKAKYTFENLQEEENHSYSVITKAGRITTTPTTCACNFNQSMKLPCRHIFSLRKELDLNLFCEELFHNRWSKAYCQ